MAGHHRTKPRCGAKTRKGTPCRCKALPSGRCRFHGGLSTGPVTAAGRRQSAKNLEKARAALADPRFAEVRSKAAKRGHASRKLNRARAQLRKMAAEGVPLAAEFLAGM